MQRWPVRRSYHAALTLALALAVAVAMLAASAPHGVAIVPPSDCGRLTVKAKRYDIKADQLRCSTARSMPGAICPRTGARRATAAVTTGARRS